MRTIVCCFSLLLFSIAPVSADQELTLSRDGKSDYVIVIPKQATPVEQTAARELRDYLAKVTGAVLPLLPDAESPDDKPRIVLGNGAATRELLPKFDPAKLSPDAIVHQDGWPRSGAGRPSSPRNTVRRLHVP